MIAIIIPVYDRFHISKKLFEALSKDRDLTVVVVDDSRLPVYQDYCRESGFSYLHGTGDLFWGGMINLGLDYLREIGLERFSRIVFANDDVIVDLESIRRLVDLDLDIVHPIVSGATGIALGSGSKLVSSLLFLTKHPFRNMAISDLPPDDLVKFDIFTGRFLVMKPSVILSLGGVRTKWFQHYGGDVDLGLRSRKFFDAFIYSGVHIFLNKEATGNNLMMKLTVREAIRGFFDIRSSHNLRVTVMLSLLNFNILVAFINILIIVPKRVFQFLYFRWKRS